MSKPCEQLGAGPTPATTEAALSAASLGGNFADTKKQFIETFEKEFLLSALGRNDGNVSQTAREIGMVRQSLQQKIRELDLRSEQANTAPEGTSTKGDTQ